MKAAFLLAVALPAFAAAPVTLPSPGQLVEVNLKAGETVVAKIKRPAGTSWAAANSGCVVVGVYEKSGSVGTAGIVLTDGIRKKSGVVRETNFYTEAGSVTVTAKDATGGFHLVYKALKQSTCKRSAANQPKA